MKSLSIALCCFLFATAASADVIGGGFFPETYAITASHQTFYDALTIRTVDDVVDLETFATLSDWRLVPFGGGWCSATVNSAPPPVGIGCQEPFVSSAYAYEGETSVTSFGSYILQTTFAPVATTSIAAMSFAALYPDYAVDPNVIANATLMFSNGTSLSAISVFTSAEWTLIDLMPWLRSRPTAQLSGVQFSFTDPDVTVTQHPVPEPATGWLCVLAIGALMMWRRAQIQGTSRI